jgi:hypothetical protein
MIPPARSTFALNPSRLRAYSTLDCIIVEEGVSLTCYSRFATLPCVTRYFPCGSCYTASRFATRCYRASTLYRRYTTTPSQLRVTEIIQTACEHMERRFVAQLEARFIAFLAQLRPLLDEPTRLNRQQSFPAAVTSAA